MEIRRVGVVGMGTMGTQIGLVSARGGYQTFMVDISKEQTSPLVTRKPPGKTYG